jgi:type I restriction enzyme S subunit
MIADLKPYAEYRASGSPWLGNIPVHWKLPRLGSVLCERKETNEKRQIEQVLSVMKRIGVIRYEDKGNIGNKRSEDTGRYKIVRPDDIVVNCMNVIIGSVGRSQYTGCLSPVYYVLTRRDETNNPRYMAAVFATKSFHESLVRIGNGILAHRMRIPMELLKCEPFPVPPPVEQDSIVRFLSWANGRLDRAIRAKRKVIALLNEQKQAIIHRAVTRGLDPSVPLKPSGIPWLGDIPHHWDLSRIKNEFVCLNPKRVPLNSVERGLMISRQYDYYGASGVIDKVDDYLFDDELLLIAEDGANLVLRNLPLAIIARGKFWVNNHAHILKPKRGNIEYLANILETLNYTPWISGAAQPKLTQDRLMSISIAVAPRDEQDTIIRFTSKQTHPLNLAISRLEREIELLREYRTRLVADVVTGKLDVREASAKLPVEEAIAPIEDDPLAEEDALEDELTEPVA